MKDFFEKNKTMVILCGVLLILIVLSAVMFLSGGSKKNEFSDTAKENPKLEEKIKEDNLSKDFIVPPKINNPFIAKDKEEAIKKEEESKEEINIPDLSESSFTQSLQEEAIKQIEKTQKPQDMSLFLKKIQKDIELIGSLKYFKYELKEYKVNDMFLNWYLIEDINRNFIRFKDLEKNYSYNLRF
ncbi:hypothetical protein CDX27_08690 [Campylobacter coli]|nr:hypothetical protein [Campylobacter coli]